MTDPLADTVLVDELRAGSHDALTALFDRRVGRAVAVRRGHQRVPQPEPPVAPARPRHWYEDGCAQVNHGC